MAWPERGRLRRLGLAGLRRIVPVMMVVRVAPAGRGEFLYDRAIRPVVADAMVGEVDERSRHLLETLRPFAEPLDMGKRHPLHVGTGAGTVFPQPEQAPNLLDGEAEIACAPHETELVDVLVAVVPVP